VAEQLSLQVWDFGGQDLYHGTHALFLSGPALVLLLWAADREEMPTYQQAGLTFCNHPLAYWFAVAQQQTENNNPLLIAQNKCDRSRDEVSPFAIPPHQRPYCKQIHLSLAPPTRGLGALKDHLQDAVAYLHDPAQGGGVGQVGAGWWRLQQTIEALRTDDAALPPLERRHRLLARADFDRLCADDGGVSSSDALLHYLDANGVVIYRPALFQGQIIVDQQWAMDALYSVFDRQKSFKILQAAGGQFNRELLADLVWQQHSSDEQRLFLSLMTACGICFEYRQPRHPGGEATYLAPDLLPEKEDLALAAKGQWDENAPTEETVFHYTLLHGGIIRAIMAAFGKQAGIAGSYWQGGFLLFDSASKSRLCIEQQVTADWQGAIRLRTQHGDSAALLEKAIKQVRAVTERQGWKADRLDRPQQTARPGHVVPPADNGENAPSPFSFAQEKSEKQEWYVSYSWQDQRTQAAKDEKSTVDELCQRAQQEHGIAIIRDVEIMRFGDSIVRFMNNLANGNRVFVLLSENSLKSNYCMFELTKIWQNQGCNADNFTAAAKVLKLDAVELHTAPKRARHVTYWKQQFAEYKAMEQDYGGLAEMPALDAIEYKRVQLIAQHIGDILATIADRIHADSLDDLITHGLRP
jgi:internalin A